MEVFECIETRMSTKSFSGKMPDEESLQKIVNAAVYAPSGMNKQSWHFTVVTNKDWLNRLVKNIADRLNRGADYDCTYNAPVLIIATADPEFYTSEADCACAMQNMYLAATALGIGACWINQLGIEKGEPLRPLLEEAGVPTKNAVYAALAIGHPPADYNRKCKTIKENAINFYR